ncbi:MAG: 1-acyl-sn-glycerol-3-phosphate acyltransferase [Chitinispirillales bacterium]|nr:1-acyl-sn-glycerol-3-phosphate acyltransferase [Chitinispirillales bacterium]
MFNKVICFLSFWVFMLYCLIMLVPYVLTFIPFLSGKRQHLVYFMQWFWSRYCIFITGAKLKISGEENIPKDNIYCVVSNHQGMLDIPILMSIFPWTLGFIAKKELIFFPILNFWMMAVGCIFLDRKRTKAAISVFKKGVELLQSAHPIAIFPEGTRSKGKAVAEFKSGALKLAQKAQAPIIPVSIDGSAILEEINLSKEVFVTIHPKIEPAEISDLDTASIAQKIRKIIVSAMRQN